MKIVITIDERTKIGKQIVNKIINSGLYFYHSLQEFFVDGTHGINFTEEEEEYIGNRKKHGMLIEYWSKKQSGIKKYIENREIKKRNLKNEM